jgi:hypothetical protein
MKVYVIWKSYPFFQGNKLVAIRLNREDAEKQAAELGNLLSEDMKPQYDEYGLVEGVEYSVYEYDAT